MKLQLSVSSPGRIVLFGEHSDYLGLTVIPAAVNLRISVKGTIKDEAHVRVIFKDINRKDQFPLTSSKIKYRWKRDYVRAGLNVLRGLGCIIPGLECSVTSTIPIGGGLSSSSALVVAWIGFLNSIAKIDLLPEEIARLAFEAEVLEFKEAGGMMDHYTSALGGLLAINFSQSPPIIEQLPAELEGFVIGDSLQKKKDTVGDIMKLKAQFKEGNDILKREHPSFDLASASFREAQEILEKHSCSKLILSAIKNRDITYKAKDLLRSEKPDSKAIGSLINIEHQLLRDEMDRSTAKIEKMIEASLNAGALGCKINGSGGGGCMIAYAPGYSQEVAEAIKAAGGKSYRVQIDSGFRVENNI
ncbi:MAG: galactokinase family protein [Candidatus Hodarchaeota archaeon]